jgi:hypothetical protein
MDVVKLGTVATGDVWMDRIASESAGVLVLNRIKLHTCFAGPVQSGITKMMVVGMGKIARDQVEDYARRKGMTIEEMERWLAPILSRSANSACVNPFAVRTIRIALP